MRTASVILMNSSFLPIVSKAQRTLLPTSPAPRCSTQSVSSMIAASRASWFLLILKSSEGTGLRSTSQFLHEKEGSSPLMPRRYSQLRWRASEFLCSIINTLLLKQLRAAIKSRRKRSFGKFDDGRHLTRNVPALSAEMRNGSVSIRISSKAVNLFIHMVVFSSHAV